MTNNFCGCAFALFVSVLCLAEMACNNHGPTALVIDQWWTEDYAREGCESADMWMKRDGADIARFGCDAVTSCKELMPIVEACAGGQIESEVRSFESDLNAFILGNPRCKGVRIFHVSRSGESPPADLPVSAWWLSFDYVPGALAQAWNMNHSPDKLHKDYYGYSSGAGSAKSTADLICGIVGVHGASAAD